MAHLGNRFLDIPIPKSVTCLPKAPPVCLSKTSDLLALDLIRDFGKEFKCSNAEITKALHLASGPSDMMIILERPADSQDYTVGFEKFVHSCPTLGIVDELIKFSTKGMRSIDTVSVVDAFMFKPKQRERIPDQKCHELLGKVIGLKKPNILLVCHTQGYSDSSMEKFELAWNDYNMGLNDVWLDALTKIRVVQSFHPSRAVNYMEFNPEYKALLLHHFIAAFSLLHRQYDEPDVVESLRSICAKKRERYLFKEWQAADRISRALDPDRTLSEAYYVGFADDCETDRLLQEKSCFDDMYQQLLQLSVSCVPIGALGISRVLVYLWKEHFRDHPSYQQVMTMLVSRGNEQACWFPEKIVRSTQKPIEFEFCQMNLCDTQLTRDMCDRPPKKNGGASDSDTLNIHDKHFNARQALREKLKRKPYSHATLLGEMIKYVEKDCLIEKELGRGSVYNLTGALRTHRLVSQVKFSIEILRTGEFQPKDFQAFLDSSDQLEHLIGQIRGKLS